MSMATDSSHRVIMGKILYIILYFIFAGNEDMYKSLNEFVIRSDAITGFHGNR